MKSKRLFFGFITMGLITVTSLFALNSVNKTFKKLNFDDIHWDI